MENEEELNNIKINEKMNSVQKENEIDNDNMNNNANLLEEKIKSNPQDNTDNNAI